MNGITNADFWSFWKQGKYKKALKEPLRQSNPAEPSNRMQSFLLGNHEEMRQTLTVGTINVGEFLYDYLRLDAMVMEGIDFARAEDLSSLFHFSRFAGNVNTEKATGDMAQLQGYVAERLVAAELQAKGYDVEFPPTSNQVGYDLLVDGEPFQVKNLADPKGVHEHLEKYPDIPVYVNQELAGHFENHPMVYTTQVEHSEVLSATKVTLNAGADLTDFEIPYITLFVSTVQQARKMLFNELSARQAVFNVFSDATARMLLAAGGQHVISAGGLLLFGPAGGLVGSGVGALLGAGQGGRLSVKFKSIVVRSEEEALVRSMTRLIRCVISRMDKKLDVKQGKLAKLNNRLQVNAAGQALGEEMLLHADKERMYSENKIRELQVLNQDVRSGGLPILDAVRPMLEKLAQTGVHPHHYQQEMKAFMDKLQMYQQKL